MAFEYQGGDALNYYPCRYGQSKLLFRGPAKSLNGDFVAAIGGTETYGKFVARPWPDLVQERLGLPVANFGHMNAGVDVFAAESEVIEAAQRARVTVIQLMGAQNMTNGFYAVHPRRNDRFVRASNRMREMFPDVDFAQFNFTRHMLGALKARSLVKYDGVVQDLRQTWLASMKALLAKLPGRKALLWIGDYHSPVARDPLGPDPLYISSRMVDQLRPLVDEVVQVQPTIMARSTGTVGMCFGPLEEPTAVQMPGPLVHEEVAEALLQHLRALI